MISIIPFISNISASIEISRTSFDDNKICENEQHIINGVPYVTQRAFYCHFASLTMIFQYYGINTTQDEVSHHSGVGYSTANRPKIIDRPFIFPPYKFQCWCGFEVSHGDADLKFLANLYGLSYKCFRTKSSTDYWQIVKHYLKKDVPILTYIDASVIPFYNISDNIINGLIFGHAIVLVGFNENNGTVCYNNPGAGPENGTYVFLDLNLFLKGVRRVCLPNNHFKICNTIRIFENISDPLPKDIAYKQVHQRNIERMKGNIYAYDQKLIRENFHKTGIEAIESLMADFRPTNFLFNFIPKIPIYKGVDLIVTFLLKKSYNFPFIDMIFSFHYLSREKHIISQYLLENKNISPICNHDAILLDMESKYWENLTLLTEELNKTVKNNSRLMKIFLLAKPILDEMVDTIDHIMFIERVIISDSMIEY